MVLATAAEKLGELTGAAGSLGVTFILMMRLPAIWAADLVIAPTLAGLFDLGALADTVRLLRFADKLPAVAVINAFPRIGRRHRRPCQRRAGELRDRPRAGARLRSADFPQRHRDLTERWPKGPGAAEIRALWVLLHKRPPPAPKQSPAATKRKAKAAS
jgi:hypothetical protein